MKILYMKKKGLHYTQPKRYWASYSWLSLQEKFHLILERGKFLWCIKCMSLIAA